jgi:ring-1,2-phenylacetyl-CoA epoxidase subunit PaaD
VRLICGGAGDLLAGMPIIARTSGGNVVTLYNELIKGSRVTGGADVTDGDRVTQGVAAERARSAAVTEAGRASARAVAEAVTDPELPMLTLADLGVLREVTEDGDSVTVAITPTYTGCPAMDTMRDDLVHDLQQAGYGPIEVRTVLTPAWSSDWISAEGRRKLSAAGIAPPGNAPIHRDGGTVPLTLSLPSRHVHCPHCGSADTGLVSYFGATACRSLYSCCTCSEPFEHVKEI